MDKLKPYLEEQGFDVFELDYPWHGRIKTRLCNRSMAKILSQVIEPGSYIFGHSNGCAIIYLLSELGVTFKYVGLINPALDRYRTILSAKYVKTYFAPNDTATVFAKLIPLSIWGNQGRVGYKGWNPLHKNTSLGNVGHSGVFNRPGLLDNIAKDAAKF